MMKFILSLFISVSVAVGILLNTACARPQTTEPQQQTPCAKCAGAQSLLQTFAEELTVATNRVAELESALQKSSAENEALQRELKRKTEEARIYKFDAVRDNPDLHELLDINDALQVQLDAYRADKQRLERQNEHHEKRLKKLQEDYREAQTLIRSLEKEIKDLEKDTE